MLITLMNVSSNCQSSVANNESGAAQASVPISDSSLLQGNYNESQSAASFQQALMAWRQGEPSNSYSPNPNSPNRAVSPVMLPGCSMVFF